MATNHPFDETQIRILHDHGRDNEIVLGERSFVQMLRIRARNVRMHIGDDCRLFGRIIINADGAELHIGNGTTFNNAKLSMCERSVMRIGDDCMFSSDISLDVSDVHSIVDAATGKRLNPPAPITIGDHVWLGQRVTVLKGATIGSHSIIGAGSVVSGEIPPNSIAAGVPARVIRSGVTWTRERLMSDAQMEEELADERLLRTSRPRRRRAGPPREMPTSAARPSAWKRIWRRLAGAGRSEAGHARH